MKKKYTEAFKKKVFEYTIFHGRKEAAKKYGVSTDTITRWKNTQLRSDHKVKKSNTRRIGVYSKFYLSLRSIYIKDSLEKKRFYILTFYDIVSGFCFVGITDKNNKNSVLAFINYIFTTTQQLQIPLDKISIAVGKSTIFAEIKDDLSTIASKFTLNTIAEKKVKKDLLKLTDRIETTLINSNSIKSQNLKELLYCTIYKHNYDLITKYDKRNLTCLNIKNNMSYILPFLDLWDTSANLNKNIFFKNVITYFQNIAFDNCEEYSTFEAENLFDLVSFTLSKLAAFFGSDEYLLLEYSYRLNRSLLYRKLGKTHKAQVLCEQVKIIGEKTNNQQLIGRSSYLLADIYMLIGKEKPVKMLLNKAQWIFNKNNDSKKICEVYKTLCKFYRQKEDFGAALEIAKKMLKLSEIIEEYRFKFDAFNSLATVHFNLNNTKKSLLLYLEGLQIAVENKDKTLLIVSYENLGIIYSTIGEYRKAEECFSNKIINCFQINNTLSLARTYLSMGNLYYRQKKYEQALISYKKATPFFINHTDKLGIYKCYCYSGVIYIIQKKLKKAKKHLHKALDIAYSMADQDKVKITKKQLDLIHNSSLVKIDKV